MMDGVADISWPGKDISSTLRMKLNCKDGGVVVYEKMS